MAISKTIIDQAVKNALREDLGHGQDITTHLSIPENSKTTVHLRAREDGILSGLEVACTAFKTVDNDIKIEQFKADGETLRAGDTIATISGKTRAILTAERVALNFLTHMCGIATQTRMYVDAVKDTNVKICDTRKTLPGLRALQKYAVTCGSGHNHRFGLDDAIMIKDNHIAAVGSVTKTLQNVCTHAPHTKTIEIEVDTLAQLEDVLGYNKQNTRGVDIVLLDNMDTATLKQAVEMVAGLMITEASGGVTLKTVHDIAKCGVDYISVGALTHSVKNFDIGLDSDD